MKILLATRNRKKVEEIQRVVGGEEIVFLSLNDFPDCPEVEEDGEDFSANAIKKAVTVARQANVWALADDSGLEVDALGGEPGVRSARYAGTSAGDQENTAKLLRSLAPVPQELRSARFQCVLALSDPEGNPRCFKGSVEGWITPAPQGNNGFGYDPIFMPLGYNRTFAEMAPVQKDGLSHRGKALLAFAQALKHHGDKILHHVGDEEINGMRLVPPHGGGPLKPLLLTGDALENAKEKAQSLEKVRMTSRETCDLIMMGIGAFTPLDGFMGSADWWSVCERTHMANGLFWPIPITLSTTSEQAAKLHLGQEVALVDDESDEIMGIMTISEKYTIDKALECQSIFQTVDMDHPGVQKVMDQHPVNLAGAVHVISEGEFPVKYAGIYMRPAETRALFESKKWHKVAAFQTRNPMHRSHEYLVKIAVEILDGVLIHQILGKLKAGDIPAEVRAKSINILLDNYFVKDTVVQAGYPMEMRYAGPKEALLHALFRQNYGCSHLIVGRDHAGVGDYYGPFDAQYIFDQVSETDLQTRPLKIDWTFYCYKCHGMASMKTCPHGKDDRLLLSGTKLRKTLSEGGQPPAEFSRPEVVKILQEYYATLAQEEKVEVKLHKAATGH